MTEEARLILISIDHKMLFYNQIHWIQIRILYTITEHDSMQPLLYTFLSVNPRKISKNVEYIIKQTKNCYGK